MYNEFSEQQNYYVNFSYGVCMIWQEHPAHLLKSRSQRKLILNIYVIRITFWANIITINCYLLDLLHGTSLMHPPIFLASDMPRHILFGTTYTAFHSNFPLLKLLPIKWKQYSMTLLYRMRISNLLQLPCQNLMKA